jgi:hydrogenase-4 membrane subunit HyfE
MDSWQILIAVVCVVLAGFTTLLARSHAIDRRAAIARIAGYLLSGAAALAGVAPLLVIIPALIGVAVSYVFLARDGRG